MTDAALSPKSRPAVLRWRMLPLAIFGLLAVAPFLTGGAPTTRSICSNA